MGNCCEKEIFVRDYNKDCDEMNTSNERDSNKWKFYNASNKTTQRISILGDIESGEQSSESRHSVITGPGISVKINLSSKERKD